MMLRATEVEVLLNELCDRGGICLSPGAREHLSVNLPESPRELADAALRAEGFDPATMDRQLRRWTVDFIADWYKRRLGVLVNEALTQLSSLDASCGGARSGALSRQIGQLNEDLIALQRGLTQPQVGMVRWVTDWIPDVDDPLVATIGAIERLAVNA